VSLPPAFAHYRILEQLGHGGVGIVYKAEDTRLGRFVALKFLAPHAAADKQALGRFRIEARAASSLNHPNICTVYDVGECEAGTFIAMELMEGESLRRRLSRGGLKPAQLLGLAIQIAEGLDAAHSKNVVHRDLKPENLFVLAQNRIKILDFGVAKLLSDRRSSPSAAGDSGQATHTASNQYSHPGAPIGTFPYMSPEQVRGEAVDIRSDLFSCGAVLFEMATKRRAFRGKSPVEISSAILTETPALPPDLEPRFRTGLQAILDKALEKQAAFRYQHASDLIADLKRLERDLAVQRMPAISAVPAPPLATLLARDLIKGATVAAVVFLTYGSFAGRASGKYLHQFQLAAIQENVRHGTLDEADFEAGGRHLPLIVDISALHPDKSLPTDRRMLDELIGELRRHGARAIGVDLSFDNLAATDFQYLHRWLTHQNVRVGIYNRAVEKREAWLGRSEFADLAAGIALPQDNPQHAISFSRRWSSGLSAVERTAAVTGDCAGGDDRGRCKEDLIQLPVALWLIAERLSVAEDGRSSDEVEARLTKLLTAQRPRSQDRPSGHQLELGTYVIDYSYLKELRRDAIKLEGGAGADISAQLQVLRAKIDDRVVLIGDLADTSDHLCYTPGMDPLPGMLVHASSLATLSRGVLFEPADAISSAAAWATATILVGIVAGLRVLHATSKRLRAWPYEHLETVVFVLMAIGVIFLCRWLAHANGLVWPYFVWASGGFILYPFAGSLHRAVAATLGMLRTSLSPTPTRVGGV
jgi:CHASE2 domain-containing sensor protein